MPSNLESPAARAKQFADEQLTAQQRMMSHYGVQELPWPGQTPVPVRARAVDLGELIEHVRQTAERMPAGSKINVTVSDNEARSALLAAVGPRLAGQISVIVENP